MEPTPTPTVSYANVTSKSTHPTKEQAIVIDSIDGIMLRDYLLSLSTVTKSTSIRFISRIANSRICVYMESKQSADDLVDKVKKIKVKDHLLEIRPLISRNKRIVLSNVCPIIPHEVLEEKFNELNVKILSPITFMKVGIPDAGFSHIMSFRRQFYVSPEDEKRLPESMQINFDETNYWIYITNDSMKCFVCNGVGHLAKYCPQNKHKMDASQPIDNPTSESNEVNNYPPIPFTKPLNPRSTNTVADNLELNKGVKRNRSSTTSEPPQSDHNQVDIEVDDSPLFSDYTDDTGSNYSVDEEPSNTKSLKKKKKTQDNRTDEQVWRDIEFELNVSPTQTNFPLTLDQLISLLDKTRNKQNIQEITKDYTENIAELINMCLFLHPKMNKSLKNRCSRFTKKLLQINTTNK